MHAPVRSLAFTSVTEWDDGEIRAMDDSLAVEEPLEIRVRDVGSIVTMRTPGHDLELATGWLLSEGLISSPDDIADFTIAEPINDASSNIVEIELKVLPSDAAQSARASFTASGCGICGKATIESIRARDLRRPNPDFRISPQTLCRLPGALLEQQAVFSQTGGLHAAALFRADGNPVVLREDIGRHNAVDKVIGWALQNHLALDQHLLLVSGRGGFEIIQKALVAGVPFLASVSAPSSLAVQLARELGLTLVGFLRGRRFVVYSAEFRCLGTESSG